MAFAIGSKFRLAAEVCNGIPIDKFPQLLTRVTKKIHFKNERLFSEDEEVQLYTLFDLTSESLDLVLSACCYIFEQAAFTGSGPEPLFNLLLEAGFSDTHAKVIGRIWASEGAEYVQKLKSRPLGAPALIDTDYHLNLNMSANSLQRLQEPTAIFELSVSNPNKTKNGVAETQKLGLEFGHDDLYGFFNQLERVQEQLDKLT
jgi:COMM domain containing 10